MHAPKEGKMQSELEVHGQGSSPGHSRLNPDTSLVPLGSNEREEEAFLGTKERSFLSCSLSTGLTRPGLGWSPSFSLALKAMQSGFGEASVVTYLCHSSVQMGEALDGHVETQPACSIPLEIVSPPHCFCGCVLL